jgi:hypothetical protein
MMLAALIGAVVAVLPVQVQSAACPSGPEVEQVLAVMLSSAPEAIRPDEAQVLRSGNRLHLQLVAADAAVIAERWIDDSGSCVELAELIAVVIASWESDVHPEFTRPHAEPMPVVLSEKPASRPWPPAPNPRSAYYEAAAGASLSYSGSPAMAGILTVGWFPHGHGPGLRLSATVESARTLDLTPGQATWRRWAGDAELDWRLPRGAWALDFHGGLALGWLAARGVGFSQNYSGSSFSPGGAIGARISRRATRSASIWFELAATYWPRKQVLYGQPNATQQEIPHYQGLASIGLTFGRSLSEK